MLNKPKFMIPSTNMQECVVDLNSNKIPFSCIVDGNETIVSWQIKIYKLYDNTNVFDTGVIDISDHPFFPVDEKNRNVVFKINLTDCAQETDAASTFDETKTYYWKETLYHKKGDVYEPNTEQAWTYDYSKLYYLDYGNFINSSDAYYWTISFTGSSGVIVQSCEEVFYANSQVIGEIQCSKDNISYSILNSIPLQHKKYYFKSTHKQAEGVGLKRYGWRIKDIDNDRILLDTISKNQIYGTYDNILCQYDGFLSDSNYSIELYIETQNGDIYLSEPQVFSVSYPSTFLDGEFIPNLLNSEPGIMIQWSDITIASGRLEGDEEYMNNFPVVGNTSIKLNNYSKIIYDYNGNANLDISDDSYITLSTRIDSVENKVLFLAEGIDDEGNELVRKLSYVPDDGSGELVYTLIKGTNVLTTRKTLTYRPHENIWYIIVMYPEQSGNIQLEIIESKANNGLYPSATKYPNTTLYPTFGTWDKLKSLESTIEEVGEDGLQ